jgi:hypothetical protein
MGASDGDLGYGACANSVSETTHSKVSSPLLPRFCDRAAAKPEMPYIKNLISSSIFIQYDTPRAVLSSFLAVTPSPR